MNETFRYKKDEDYYIKQMMDMNRKSVPADKMPSMDPKKPRGDDHQKCCVPFPYPETEDVKKNRRTASLLQSPYAGKDSEFTATSEYMYQHFVLEEREPELADDLRCIGICEMKHVALLGECIEHLGGDPRYYALEQGSPRYWSGRYIPYTKDVDEILKRDIEAEHKAIKDYKRLIKIIDDETIKLLLERIILDEELHLKILNSYLDD